MNRNIQKEMLVSPHLKERAGGSNLPTPLQSSPKSLALQLWALWEMDKRKAMTMWAEIGGSEQDEDFPGRGSKMKIEKSRIRPCKTSD